MTVQQEVEVGEVAILNVAGGDTKVTFDKSNKAETIRAGRIIQDMLRRGYMLLVEDDDGEHVRVREFDEDKCEYIIADLVPEEDDNDEQTTEETQAAAPAKRGRRKKSVSASGRRSVAVAPIAGG